ncbi:MAG TPA: DUF3325 family protein [Polyangiaceae bacterium]|nr:DUF3325 family protein [Polyangiaceae bacterium]
MAEKWFLLLALGCGLCGMAWLSLTLPSHFQQVFGPPALSRQSTKTLRLLGAGALLASLLACLRADHLSMAGLVWLMLLSASALLVAFTLAWQPRWLAWFVAWLR